MGVVYLAFDEQLERRVAIKTLDIANVSAALTARLRREAQLLGQLEHPGIVTVHDFGCDADETHYYVMRYVDGQTLEEYAPSISSVAARLRLLLRICEPVAFAHARGVIHRDLKPSNIMIGRFGEVWVLDWGLAVTDPAGPTERGESVAAPAPLKRMTQAGTILGTPGYRAPEQEHRCGEITSAVDIFALGAVTAYLLTHRHPEVDASLDLGGVPAPLRAIIRKACAADPLERYASVLEFAGDLGRHLDGERVLSYDEPWFATMRRWVQRYRFVIALLAAYLALRVLLGFWGR
jgi:serine/threonine-protein kinase